MTAFISANLELWILDGPFARDVNRMEGSGFICDDMAYVHSSEVCFAADNSMMNADAGIDMRRSSGHGSSNQLKGLGLYPL